MVMHCLGPICAEPELWMLFILLACCFGIAAAAGQLGGWR